MLDHFETFSIEFEKHLTMSEENLEKLKRIISGILEGTDSRIAFQMSCVHRKTHYTSQIDSHSNAIFLRHKLVRLLVKIANSWENKMKKKSTLFLELLPLQLFLLLT
jgi:hypothetical protein